jgi:hypothetical protein
MQLLFLPRAQTDESAYPLYQAILPHAKSRQISVFGCFEGTTRMNDNESEHPVTIITGRVWRRKGGAAEGVHVMLVAPDDDSAVRRALESLSAEGYAEAELDQIGEMEGAPDEEPHLSAWQGALEGEVSVITFDVPA